MTFRKVSERPGAYAKPMSAPDSLPRFPSLGARVLARLPLAPLRWVIGHVADRATARHPGIVERLGEYVGKRFLVDPTDLPFAVLLVPVGTTTRVDVLADGGEAAYDARIAGTLAALIGMIQGRLDGDALFFSRDLTIEGDTAAVVALRNALDDAEIDLVEEFTRSLGPLSAPARSVAGPASTLIERLTGVPLTRPGRST